MNTTPSTQADVIPLYIDASTLEGHFMACPRKFEYYATLKREANEPMAGRAFGRAVHAWRAAWRRGTTPDVAALHAAEGVPDTDYRNLGYFKGVIDAYTTAYPTEPFTTALLGDKPCIEQSFAFPLGTVECASGAIVVIWTGVLDEATVWPDGSTWVLDLKTSKVAGETFWKGWQNSHAQIGYCWAWQRAFGTAPAGYIIDGVFTRELTASGRGKGIECLRQKYYLDAERLDEWEHNTLQIVAELLDCQERGFFPMHSSACMTRYGACEYLEVCKLPASQRRAMLASNMFKDVTWSPLNV